MHPTTLTHTQTHTQHYVSLHSHYCSNVAKPKSLSSSSSGSCDDVGSHSDVCRVVGTGISGIRHWRQRSCAESDTGAGTISERVRYEHPQLAVLVLALAVHFLHLFQILWLFLFAIF
jgi:hypothetical protein